MDVLRRMVDSQPERFDPEKRGSWRGTSRDLVVNSAREQTDGLQGTRFDTYRNEPDGYATHAAKGRWFIPAMLSYSDYHGGALARSNVEVWAEEFEDGEGEWWHFRREGHGAKSIMIDLEAPDMPEEALKILTGLEDYPVISEERMSEREDADEYEAWERGVRRDFIRALERELGIEIEDEYEEGDDEDPIRDLFDEKMEEKGWYWDHSPEGAYFDANKVAKLIELEDLDDADIEYEEDED